MRGASQGHHHAALIRARCRVGRSYWAGSSKIDHVEASVAGTNQDFATRWFENVWNMRRREAIGEMLAPDVLIHEAGLTMRGPEGFYPFFDRMQSAFSQIHVTVEETITQGDHNLRSLVVHQETYRQPFAHGCNRNCSTKA